MSPIVEEPESRPARRDASSDTKPSRRSRLRSAVGWLPNIAVFGLLISVAWFGHANDWRLPSRSEASSPIAGPEWCEAHGVPEEKCIVCQPGLIEAPRETTFCQTHGVHGCVYSDPSLAMTKVTPEVKEDDLARAMRALSIRPRRENNSLSPVPGTRVQFASLDAMRQSGVDVEPVTRRAVAETISAPAEVRYDETRTARISPAADGVIRQVLVQVGESVEAGQVLAVLDSEKVGRQKSELSAALSEEKLRRSELSRIERATKSGAVSKQRFLEVQGQLRQAEVAVARAARALRNFGIELNAGTLRKLDSKDADEAVRGLGQSKLEGDVGENWIAVEAPLAGRVTTRDAVVGEVVERGEVLFQVSDTSTMWLDLRVRAEDAALVSLGQTVRFESDGGRNVSGPVVWISSDVDTQTRTVRVRAEVPNADGQLRNEQFGTGEVVLREEPEAIVVPDDAVQWDGQNMLVFVRDARFFEEDRPKFFVARSVRTGVSQDGFTEIIAGVLPGEVVATGGSDVLRAQLLKSNLGAGCTCGH